LQRDLVISSDLANITKVRFFLDQIFVESGLDKCYFNRVLLGLSEAVNNSIVHGNKLNVDKLVHIHILVLDNNLLIQIIDEGNGFEIGCINDPTCFENIKKERGRGIFLIRQMADDIRYYDGGRKVMIKYNLGE
jgi:serine/threonine-protein kinase RsbW